MEIGLAVLLFVCMTALLYVILSLKITRQVDLQIKEFYKTRIHNDMKEFYRDMESYAAMFDTRIERFQTLMRRGEEVARSIDSDTRSTESPSDAVQALSNSLASDITRTKTKKPEPVIDSRKSAKTLDHPVAATKGKMTKKGVAAAPVPKNKLATAPQPKAAKPASKATQKEILSPVSEKAKAAAERATVKPAQQPRGAPVFTRAAMVEDRLETADDSAIAEELMRDLYERDQLNLTASGRDSNSTAAVGKPAPIKLTENTDEGTEANAPVKNFLSSIGKALGPMVFGEKKPVMKSVAANTDSENKPTIARTIAAAPEPAQSDFTAVLRRAEQIKAEKKAERERAEISARAEFYATGDNFQPRTAAASPTFERPMLAPLPEPRREAPAEASFGAQVQASPRNSLAVKELDAHMKGFLIDSLKSDNGYRKQALRVLTENNVSLDEIARLSKIDIGELELMRQLGRF